MTLKTAISLGWIASLFGGLWAQTQPLPLCVQKKVLNQGPHTTQMEAA